MGKPRSPVLGFNHNVRHVGWLFHVQTEDSGVSNPHIFTHLFHDGVIIASKKMVYDSNSDVDVVKGLMQAQHKSVLRELKSGTYDAKIRQYLGAPPGSGDVEYDEVSVEHDADAARTPTPTPTPAVAKPTTVGAVADLGDTTKPHAKGSPGAPVPSATDVSAAFRAISHASAQMNVSRKSGTTAPPPAAAPPPPPPDDAAELVFAAPGAAAPPPGSGVWSAKPEHAQERPFDRTGGYPAIREKGRTIPPPTGEGSDPGAYSARPARSTGAPPSGAAGLPGVRPAPRPTGAPPQGASPRPAGSVPPTNRPAGSPPAIPGGRHTTPPSTSAPAARPPMVQGQPARPAAGARPAGSPPGTQPPSRPVPPARGGAPAPGTQPPAGAPRTGAPGSPNVIVARPAVIVGAPPQVVGGAAGARRPGTGPREAIPGPASDSIFGKDLISEKSLDEVIMAYLSEDANDD